MVSRSATTKEKKPSGTASKRSNTKGAKKVTDAKAAASWRKGGEITGLILLALSVAVTLALLSSDPVDIETDGQVGNLIGPVGAYAADILLYIFGIGSFVVVSVLFMLGGFMLIGRRPELKPSEFVGQGLFVISGAILCHLIFAGQTLFGHPAGGLVGDLLGGLSTALVGVLGSYILAGCMALSGRDAGDGHVARQHGGLGWAAASPERSATWPPTSKRSANSRNAGAKSRRSWTRKKTTSPAGSSTTTPSRPRSKPS